MEFAQAQLALWEKIRAARVAMLTTVGADGELASRPMTLVQDRFDGILYFFTARDAGAVTAIALHPGVNVTFSDAANDHYVTLTGHAALEESQTLRTKLWTPMVRAWFPGGPNDPNVGLIAVTVHQAEFWDINESEVTQVLKIAQALVTGTRMTLGQHGKVDF